MLLKPLTTGVRYNLGDFRKYLVNLGELAPSTIALYVSLVRTALRQLPSTSLEDVREYAFRATNPSFVAAWNRFAAYATRSWEVSPVPRKGRTLSAPASELILEDF